MKFEVFDKNKRPIKPVMISFLPVSFESLPVGVSSPSKRWDIIIKAVSVICWRRNWHLLICINLLPSDWVLPSCALSSKTHFCPLPHEFSNKPFAGLSVALFGLPQHCKASCRWILHITQTSAFWKLTQSSWVPGKKGSLGFPLSPPPFPYRRESDLILNPVIITRRLIFALY